jgi:ectoine hydroxylase-related dioxygenase (phytanoyl-CoA dioxygenase family)
MSGPQEPDPGAESAGLAAHRDRIERDGYTVLPGVIGSDRVEALREDLLRIERDRGVVPADNEFEGSRTIRIYNLLIHGRLYEEIPVEPAVLPLVEQVLDSGCLISSLSSISIGPGESAQPIHSDDILIPLPKPRPAIVCNTMWALTDFTEENGATRVVPGSHKRESPEYGAQVDTIPAELAAGSVLVWDGSLWHGGGANRTSERRVGIAMNYCAGFIRQQENQQLGIPREVARRFTPRLRRLVGYGLYHGLIGHIEKHDPAELLGSPGRPLTWDR